MSKEAKWKPIKISYGKALYECINCGVVIDMPTVMGKPQYSYCPMCGAKCLDVLQTERSRR